MNIENAVETQRSLAPGDNKSRVKRCHRPQRTIPCTILGQDSTNVDSDILKEKDETDPDSFEEIDASTSISQREQKAPVKAVLAIMKIYMAHLMER